MMIGRGRGRPSKKVTCPAESCKPTKSLQEKLGSSVKSSATSKLTGHDLGEINKAFPLSNQCSTMGTLLGKRTAEPLDQELMEKYCPERSPGFFSGEYFKKVEDIYMKIFYMPWAGQMFIFWAKDNTSGDSNVGPSYFRISSFELDDYIENIDMTIADIDRNKPKLIESLKHVNASVCDTNDDRCWDRAFSYSTPSGGLLTRPYRNNVGIYQFKLWIPKPPQKFGDKICRGPNMTINLCTMKLFVSQLKKYKKQIQQLHEAQQAGQTPGRGDLDRVSEQDEEEDREIEQDETADEQNQEHDDKEESGVDEDEVEILPPGPKLKSLGGHSKR